MGSRAAGAQGVAPAEGGQATPLLGWVLSPAGVVAHGETLSWEMGSCLVSKQLYPWGVGVGGGRRNGLSLPAEFTLNYLSSKAPVTHS